MVGLLLLPEDGSCVGVDDTTVVVSVDWLVGVGMSEKEVSGFCVTVTVGASVILVVPPPAKPVTELATRNAVDL